MLLITDTVQLVQLNMAVTFLPEIIQNNKLYRSYTFWLLSEGLSNHSFITLNISHLIDISLCN